MDNRIDWILKRRSIRRFDKRKVDEEKINILMQAAMAAPSARNQQPWHFVVVTDSQQQEKLAELHPSGSIIREAPLCVAVCGDPDRARSPNTKKTYWVQDCSAAMQNLLLAVSSLDLGGVWLGVHPVEDRQAKIGQVLNLPSNLKTLGLAAIGYPGEEKESGSHYLAEKVHLDRFGEKGE